LGQETRAPKKEGRAKGAKRGEREGKELREAKHKEPK
jgi:hypothetical protein